MTPLDQARGTTPQPEQGTDPAARVSGDDVLESPIRRRSERACELSSGRRMAMLASFARGRDVSMNTRGRTYPELHGLHRFQRWLTHSGRVADGDESIWWSQVNGLILLDMAESAGLGPQGADGRSEPVRAWTTYWTNRTRAERTRLCWDAHQCSLAAAARAAEHVLSREPPTERDFITLALSSVKIAALANLPTGKGGQGSWAVSAAPSTRPPTPPTTKQVPTANRC
jgi:hypothetical protein